MPSLVNAKSWGNKELLNQLALTPLRHWFCFFPWPAPLRQRGINVDCFRNYLGIFALPPSELEGALADGHSVIESSLIAFANC